MFFCEILRGSRLRFCPVTRLRRGLPESPSCTPVVSFRRDVDERLQPLDLASAVVHAMTMQPSPRGILKQEESLQQGQDSGWYGRQQHLLDF